MSLDDIKRGIAVELYTTLDKAYENQPGTVQGLGLDVMTLCTLVMHNGFVIIGKAAPASPENFNADLGRKLAYEDAVRQAWPLMGFALKDRLWRDSDDAMKFHRLSSLQNVSAGQGFTGAPGVQFGGAGGGVAPVQPG